VPVGSGFRTFSNPGNRAWMRPYGASDYAAASIRGQRGQSLASLINKDQTKPRGAYASDSPSMNSAASPVGLSKSL
jgi:hypothetical protein